MSRGLCGSRDRGAFAQWQLAGIMVAVVGYFGQPSPELTAYGCGMRVIGYLTKK